MRRLLLRWPSLKWRLPLAAMALLTMRPISPFVSVSRGQGQSQSRVACAAKGYGVLRRLMQLQDDFLSLPKTKEFVLDRDWPKDRLLNVEEFLQHQESERPCPVLDVRSPKEFHKGHVPGARNLPLLNDDERAAVGTMFAQIGAKEAFDLALESVHPKLATLLRQAGENVDSEAHEAKLLLYCKRGGMRSQSMAKLLSRHGLDVMVLTGGYKAFRTWAEQTLREKPQKVCVIAGATGSGKTDILEEIQRQGLGQVINLEAMARHKGSVFGALGEEAQPSSEQLRNDLAIKWSKLCSSKWVYLEDEGARIGEAVLPSSLYQRLRGASLVLHLDVAFALRATRSLELYGPFGAEALCSAVENFRHRMGHRYTDELQELLRQGQLRPVCEEILRNYDKAYDYHLNRGRRKDQILRLEVSSLNCSAVAHDVVVPAAAAREAAAPEDTARLPSGESKSAQVREAKCFCGAVISRATGDPAAVSICHCSICRRLSGAPFVASAVFLPQRVQFLSSLDGGEPQLTELQTSKEVTRLRCANCSAPVAGRIGKRFVALPLGSFVQPGEARAAWKPKHHLHYDSRIMDMSDDLVKYRGRSRGPVWDADETNRGPRAALTH